MPEYSQKTSAVDPNVYGALAGAVRFELTARGFGVDVEKAWADMQQPAFRAVEPQVSQERTSHAIFDALLVISGKKQPRHGAQNLRR